MNLGSGVAVVAIALDVVVVIAAVPPVALLVDVLSLGSMYLVVVSLSDRRRKLALTVESTVPDNDPVALNSVH